jgi:class 3 adenylate cyclase
VARLSAAERAKLPDRAFAYVDSAGVRRLPIYDASHVRNALARFNQVPFEDDRAREVARTRLLQAARRFRIVPVGFIGGELRAERQRAAPVVDLPSGFVTMLMTDIESSTALLHELGDGYEAVLETVRRIQREACEQAGGIVVETRADELFAVFESPRCALHAAVAAQRALAAQPWDHALPVRVRAGLHAGYPTRSSANYIGMAVHTTARICSSAHGGQVVVSADTRTALTGMARDGVRFRSLGAHRLRGIPDEVILSQVVATGLRQRFPALRT